MIGCDGGMHGSCTVAFIPHLCGVYRCFVCKLDSTCYTHDMQQEYYTPEQVAELFQVTRQAVYKWIREGKLEAVELAPRVTRVTRAALDTFVKPKRAKEEKPGSS